jgi:hypothetical protein
MQNIMFEFQNTMCSKTSIHHSPLCVLPSIIHCVLYKSTPLKLCHNCHFPTFIAFFLQSLQKQWTEFSLDYVHLWQTCIFKFFSKFPHFCNDSNWDAWHLKRSLFLCKLLCSTNYLVFKNWYQKLFPQAILKIPSLAENNHNARNRLMKVSGWYNNIIVLYFIVTKT